MFDYNLALLTGVDIPFPEFELILHQPTIREISMIGETVFFTGLQLLCIDAKMYIENEALLAQTSNFSLFVTMMNEKQLIEKKDCVIQVLTLLIPQAKVIFTPGSMLINFSEKNIIIDEGNFAILQQFIKKMFCLDKAGMESYNPQGNKAKAIAQKLLKARQKVASLKENNGDSILGRYLSVVTIGVGSMSLQDCCNLTLYQLYDLIERYTLYINWDIDIRSRMAGAKGDKPVEDWMKNIHEN